MQSDSWFHVLSKGLGGFFKKNSRRWNKSSNDERTNEEHLRLLFDSSPAGIAVVQAQTGKRLYANPRLLELFAVASLEELNACDMASTYVDENDFDQIHTYIKSGTAFRRDIVERRTVNGERWWALLDAVPMEFMGEPTIVVWHTDITDQKKAENELESALGELKASRDALQASEERLRFLLDTSPAGIAVRGVGNGKRIYANNRFLEMFAVETTEELDAFDTRNTYASEEDWRKVRAHLQSGEGLKDLVIERKRVNGERWWSLLDAVPMVFQGEPSMIFWHHDITHQKQADAELSNLMESSPIGVSIIGREISERTYINNQYLGLFGAESLEQLEAYGYENSFVSRDDFELACRHFETGIGPDSSIMQRRKVNGEEWWAKIFAVPIEFRGQKTFIIWCTDITDQKQAEAELVQSEKLASLGGLVAGVAHEVNTPIGIGVTAASHLHERTADLKEMLAQGHLKKSSLEEFLETALQSSAIISANLKRAADLVRSFKQVAVDQSSDETRRFNLLEYVREVMQSLNPQLRKKPSVSVMLDGDENLDMVGYPGPVAQILTNLVLNTVTHGFPGDEPGRISIRVHSEGDMAHLVYKDSGKGIAPENLKNIFDPFYTTNRSGGSSGLGMHIVYNLVTQKIGGAIKCTSTLGEGVVFDIRLPLRIGDEE